MMVAAVSDLAMALLVALLVIDRSTRA